jgi:hypothetical protein
LRLPFPSHFACITVSAYYDVPVAHILPASCLSSAAPVETGENKSTLMDNMLASLEIDEVTWAATCELLMLLLRADPAHPAPPTSFTPQRLNAIMDLNDSERLVMAEWSKFLLKRK